MLYVTEDGSIWRGFHAFSVKFTPPYAALLSARSVAPSTEDQSS